MSKGPQQTAIGQGPLLLPTLTSPMNQMLPTTPATQDLNQAPDNGGKGEITQQVHWEFIEGSETICLPFTQ